MGMEPEPATAEIEYLERVTGMGLRHASVVRHSIGPAAPAAILPE
jgi:hypothetical protein